MKKYIPFIAFLDITDMIGSIGAEHYYGKIKFRHDNIREEIELTYPMSAKEALYLNKKCNCEGPYGRYRPGEESYKFYSPEDIKRIAIKLFSEKYPNDLLLLGDGCNLSAQYLLYWPKEYDDLAKQVNDLAKQWEDCGGYGDWRGKGGDDKKASEIDDKWYKLLKPFYARNN